MSEPTQTSPQWRPPETPSAGWRIPRRMLAMILGGALLALAGGVTAWLLYLRDAPRPRFLPLSCSEYSDEVPIRRWARQDGEALRALPWQSSQAFTRQQRSLLLGELQGLANLRSNSDVVVYLGAYALPNAEGDLCILPVDAQLDQPQTWIPLREVFALIAKCPARHKLLLLDVMQPLIVPEQGLILNDSAERLSPVLKAALAQDNRLTVFCACAPGQTSWTADELGHSVFAYHLLRGLSGLADSYNDAGKKDARVSAQELAAYVTESVDRWVQDHRRVRQTPLLLGAKADFQLVTFPEGDVSSEPREYPGWLLDHWKQRDQQWKQGTYRRARLPYRLSETALLSADRHWRGGGGEQIRADLDERLRRLTPTPPPPRRPPVSLADAGLMLNADAESVTELTDLAALSAMPKPDEAKAKRLASGKADVLKKFAGKPLDLALSVVEAATRDRPSPGGYQFLLGMLTAAKVPPLAETTLLQRLAKLPEGSWSAEGVRHAMQAGWEAEKAAVADPAARAISEPVLQNVAQQRKTGEDLLLKADPQASKNLEQTWRTYQAVNRDLGTIQEAQILRDKALILLPGYVPVLEVDPGSERTWEKAVAAAIGLRAILAEPKPGTVAELEKRASRLSEATESLLAEMRLLRAPLGPDHQLGPADGKLRLDERSVRAILESPWPSGPERANLWKQWHRLLSTPQSKRISTPPDEARAIAAERQTAVRRARWSLAVLKLRGASNLEKLEETLARAERTEGAAETLPPLAAALRQAWHLCGAAEAKKE